VSLWLPEEFIGTIAGLPEPQSDPNRFLHLADGRYFLGNAGGPVEVPATSLLGRIAELYRGRRKYLWRALDGTEDILFVRFERLGSGTISIARDASIIILGERPERATHFETVEGFVVSLAEPVRSNGHQGVPPGRYPGEFFWLSQPSAHRLSATIVAVG